jgi:hypothetical protein
LKRCAIIPVLWLFFSAPSLADLTLRYDALTGGNRHPAQRIRLAHGMLRIDPLAGPDMSILIDLQRGRLIQIRHDRKRYFSIPLTTLLQYGSLYENNRTVFQGLIDQGLRQLDPRQRAQAERFLGQLKHPKRAQIRLQPLNRRAEVLGLRCESVALLQPGSAARELCIGRYRDLGLDPQDQASLDQLGELAEALQQMRMSQWFDGVARAWRELDGLPLEIRALDRDGRVREHWRLGRLSRSPIADETMQIPPGYQPSNTPLI